MWVRMSMWKENFWLKFSLSSRLSFEILHKKDTKMDNFANCFLHFFGAHFQNHEKRSLPKMMVKTDGGIGKVCRRDTNTLAADKRSPFSFFGGSTGKIERKREWGKKFIHFNIELRFYSAYAGKKFRLMPFLVRKLKYSHHINNPPPPGTCIKCNFLMAMIYNREMNAELLCQEKIFHSLFKRKRLSWSEELNGLLWGKNMARDRAKISIINEWNVEKSTRLYKWLLSSGAKNSFFSIRLLNFYWSCAVSHQF